MTDSDKDFNLWIEITTLQRLKLANKIKTCQFIYFHYY